MSYYVGVLQLASVYILVYLFVMQLPLYTYPGTYIRTVNSSDRFDFELKRLALS